MKMSDFSNICPLLATVAGMAATVTMSAEELDRVGVLLVFVDDATSRLMDLRFARSESTFEYFTSVQRYLDRHGRPVAFYSDKATIFRFNRKDHGGDGLTQFGQAMQELTSTSCAQTARLQRAASSARTDSAGPARQRAASGRDQQHEEGNRFLEDFMATTTGASRDRRELRRMRNGLYCPTNRYGTRATTVW
jgi:hypothetical protein